MRGAASGSAQTLRAVGPKETSASRQGRPLKSCPVWLLEPGLQASE